MRIDAPSAPFAEPFERIADTMADIHDRLVARLAPRPGERWLDLATGTGPVSRRAARAGADVTGLDRREALHRAFVDLVNVHRDGPAVRFPREYLLAAGRRR